MIAATLALVCVPGTVVAQPTESESKETFDIPAKNLVLVEDDDGNLKPDLDIKFGYLHYLRKDASEKEVYENDYHTMPIPAKGDSTRTKPEKKQTTEYKKGECISKWDLEIKNQLLDGKYLTLGLHKLHSKPVAPPKPLVSSAAISKEFITVNGYLIWLESTKMDKLYKRKTNLPKKATTSSTTEKRIKMAADLKETVKKSGFKGVPALGLVDLYVDMEGTSWNVHEEFMGIDSIEIANYTFGIIAAGNSTVNFNMGSYEGAVRLEADTLDSIARMDLWLETINEGTVIDGTALLEEGIFTATGSLYGLPWIFEEFAPGVITSATLDGSYLPEVGWEIDRDDINTDPTYWETEKPFYMHVEDVAYDAVPEPATLALLGLGGLMLLRRRRG